LLTAFVSELQVYVAAIGRVLMLIHQISNTNISQYVKNVYCIAMILFFQKGVNLISSSFKPH